LAGEVPAPESFGGAPTQPVPQVPGISPLAGEVPAPESFGSAPTQAAPQVPGPISSLDPAFGDAPAPQAPGPVSSLDPALGNADPLPDSVQPETQDAPTLRDPPIPNLNEPFPEPDIRLKPFEPRPLRTITIDPPSEPAPEGAPDTVRTPESSAPATERTPESSAPETVRDPSTVRTPDLDPPPSSVQPEAPTVPAGPPSVDPADPIIPQAPRLPSFGPGNPEPIDPTAPTERAPVPEPVAEGT
jgi:DNA polymerase-3 subunit gamma/tau